MKITDQRIKVTTNFYWDEIVPPSMYVKGIQYCIDRIDGRIPVIIQFIRDEVGAIKMNNWYDLLKREMTSQNITEINDDEIVQFLNDNGHINYLFDERGARDPKTSTGAKKSRHKFEEQNGIIIRKSDASDLDSPKLNGKKGYDFVKANVKELYALGVTTIEHYSLTPGWLHLDCRPPKKENHIAVIDLEEVVEYIPVL